MARSGAAAPQGGVPGQMTDSREQAGSRSLLGRLAHRLRTRPDSEHEMRFNGVILSTATLIYLLATQSLGRNEFIVYAAYTAFCLLIFSHILLRPEICHTRRVLAMVGDFGVLSCEMYIRGETAAFLFPLFIWVILGNGFRFGIPFLALATSGGLAAFGATIITTPFWSSQIALSSGLLGSMLLVSLCVAPLIHRLSKAKRQAETANREKNVLLASVSHELRMPLSAIVGTGAVLQDTKLDPAQQKMTQSVISAGQHLLTRINDISDISRAGKAGSD